MRDSRAPHRRGGGRGAEAARAEPPRRRAAAARRRPARAAPRTRTCGPGRRRRACAGDGDRRAGGGRRRAARARPRDPPGGADGTRARRPRSRASRTGRPCPSRARRRRRCGIAEPVEAAAYFVVSESLANVATLRPSARGRPSASARRTTSLAVEVVTTASAARTRARGTGLRGLADRVAALDGSFAVESPPGAGTRVRAEIPLP